MEPRPPSIRSRIVGAALAAVAGLTMLPGCASPGDTRAAAASAVTRGTGLDLELVASGLHDPVYLTAPPGDPRLFVCEQVGRVRIIRNGRPVARPFLDLAQDVGYGGERGLLSLAFHPRYRENGRFFVNYTDRNGDTRIERFEVGPEPDLANPASRKLVMEIHQPFANHNGGHILFGPDGMLYVGMGDGGSGGDPQGNGQNRGTLLGSLLRIDVDRGDPYAIPPDNPFAGRPGLRGEIWAWGLRNPWRFCFDPEDGLLYVADVGQNRWEEVNVAGAREAGLNYGWNLMEGAHCYRPGCDRTGLVEPVVEYGHREGCSVTGGFVYRGRALPGLIGHYFYGDYCEGWVRSFRWQAGRVEQHRQWAIRPVGNILSFGTDAGGEMYLCTSEGRIWRLVGHATR